MLDHLQGTPNLTPLPEAESAVLRRALAKNPADRFGSCQEFVQALHQTIKPEHVIAPVSPPKVSPPSPVSRGRERFLTAVLASLLGLAVLVGLGFLGAKWWPSLTGKSTSSSDIADLLPRNLKRDFGLKVQMVGGSLSPSGTHLLTEGQEVVFRIEAERDAYVVILTVAPDHETIKQLFPNDEEPDNLVKAGISRLVPGRNYGIAATSSEGKEWVWVWASNQKRNALDGRREGPFVVFSTPQERQKLKDEVRGLGIILKNAPKGQILVAEELLTFQVSPKN